MRLVVPQRDERRRKANCLSLGRGVDWVPCHPGVTRSPTCVCDAPSHAPMGIPRSMQMRRPGDDRTIQRAGRRPIGDREPRGHVICVEGTQDTAGRPASRPVDQSTSRPVDRSTRGSAIRSSPPLCLLRLDAWRPSLDGREETITSRHSNDLSLPSRVSYITMNHLRKAGKEALLRTTRGFASSSLPDRKVAVLGAAGTCLTPALGASADYTSRYIVWRGRGMDSGVRRRRTGEKSNARLRLDRVRATAVPSVVTRHSLTRASTPL